jgi:predicted hydrolase (HD superfamily)
MKPVRTTRKTGKTKGKTMNREDAWNLVTQHLKTDHLLKHVLATEACMASVARRLGEDESIWGLAGLVHDLDLDIVNADPDRHGKVTAGILKEQGYGDEIIHAVLAHAGHKPPESRMEKALCAVDPTTGFIVAATLVRPDRKIDGLEPKSVRKRMKDKRFAANVDRDKMRSIEELGLDFNEYLGLCIEAMKAIGPRIGL